MKCRRCQGMMVQDRFVDVLGEPMEFVGWRCVQCGAIVDPVILGNRIDRPVPAVSRVRRTFTW